MALKGEAKTDYQREYMRRRRVKFGSNHDYKRRQGNCEVCGYGETIDLHHEGEQREEHVLCPTCHALITRGIKTLEQLMEGSNVKVLDPKQDKLTSLRELIASPGTPQSTTSPVKQEGDTLPRYNPFIHKPGDKVLVLRGKRWLPYLIPDVDGSGQEVPDYW